MATSCGSRRRSSCPGPRSTTLSEFSTIRSRRRRRREGQAVLTRGLPPALGLPHQASRAYAGALEALPGALLYPLERTPRFFGPVLVEFGELQVHGRVIDRRCERLEIGDGARPLASSFEDVGPGPQRIGGDTALDRGMGGCHGPIERTRTTQRSRDSCHLGRAEPIVKRL